MSPRFQLKTKTFSEVIGNNNKAETNQYTCVGPFKTCPLALNDNVFTQICYKSPPFSRQASSPHHQIGFGFVCDGICHTQETTNTETAMLST